MLTIYYGEYQCDHFSREIEKAKHDLKHHREVGDVARITGSEHYILTVCRAVRVGELRTDEVLIYCGTNEFRVDLDVKGDFIQPWPDDLFEAAFYLRFDIPDSPPVQEQSNEHL